MIRMTAVKIVSGLKSMAFVDNIGEIFAGKANCGTKVRHVSATCPVSKTNRYSVWIILFKSVNVGFVLYNIRSEFFSVRCVHMGYCIQCSQKDEINVTVKC